MSKVETVWIWVKRYPGREKDTVVMAVPLEWGREEVRDHLLGLGERGTWGNHLTLTSWDTICNLDECPWLFDYADFYLERR